MSVIERNLRDLKKSSELVHVFRERLTDEPDCGIVRKLSDEFLYMSIIDGVGNSDGIAILRIEDITRFRWGGNERDSLRRIMEASIPLQQVPEIDLSSESAALKSVDAAYGYVTIYAEQTQDDLGFLGRIKDLDESAVLLEEFGTFSTRDLRQLVLSTGEISKIGAGSEYDSGVFKLFS